MPMGMTLLLKALDDALPASFDREWTDRLLREMASRAGVPEEALRKRPAPFAISSPLPAEGHRPASEARSGESAQFRMRLSWLADTDLQGLLNWAGTLKSEPVWVETNCGRMLLEDAMVAPTLTQRWNRWVPYGRLHEDASDCMRLVTLKFYSPTTLERSGNPYPLPDPCGIFRGYWTIWDAFSGIALAPGLLEAIEEHLQLVDFRIQRRLSAEGTGAVPGFVGSAKFRLEGRHPESILKGLNALADYAFFCGTGAGTERGMGLTRRILEGGDRR